METKQQKANCPWSPWSWLEGDDGYIIHGQDLTLSAWANLHEFFFFLKQQQLSPQILSPLLQSYVSIFHVAGSILYYGLWIGEWQEEMRTSNTQAS